MDSLRFEVEADLERIVVDSLSLSSLFQKISVVSNALSFSSLYVIFTYRQVPRIPHKPRREHVNQTIHTQIPQLRKVNQIVAPRKEPRSHNPKQPPQEENKAIAALSRLTGFLYDDFRDGRETDLFGGCGRVFSGGLVFAQETVADRGHDWVGRSDNAR